MCWSHLVPGAHLDLTAWMEGALGTISIRAVRLLVGRTCVRPAGAGGEAVECARLLQGLGQAHAPAQQPSCRRAASLVARPTLRPPHLVRPQPQRQLRLGEDFVAGTDQLHRQKLLPAVVARLHNDAPQVPAGAPAVRRRRLHARLARRPRLAVHSLRLFPLPLSLAARRRCCRGRRQGAAACAPHGQARGHGRRRCCLLLLRRRRPLLRLRGRGHLLLLRRRQRAGRRAGQLRGRQFVLPGHLEDGLVGGHALVPPRRLAHSEVCKGRFWRHARQHQRGSPLPAACSRNASPLAAVTAQQRGSHLEVRMLEYIPWRPCTHQRRPAP